MEVIALKNMLINLHTGKVVPSYARVYKDNIYTVEAVEVEDNKLFYFLREIPENCKYLSKNFAPLEKYLEQNINIEELIKEEEEVLC